MGKHLLCTRRGDYFGICQLLVRPERESDQGSLGQQKALQTLIIRVPPSVPLGLSLTPDKFGGRRKDKQYITHWVISSQSQATSSSAQRNMLLSGFTYLPQKQQLQEVGNVFQIKWPLNCSFDFEEVGDKEGALSNLRVLRKKSTYDPNLERNS